MAYPDGTVPTTETVHPTPVYETIGDGARGLGAVAAARPLQAGVLFALYLVAAGLERFLVEFLRRNDHVAAGLTSPQLESLVMVVAGAVWLLVAARRGGLSRAPSPPAGPEASRRRRPAAASASR